MATHTPPPYFPQSSLAPPDQRRYRKFKLLMFAVAVLVLLVLGAIGYGAWVLVRSIL